MSAAPVFKIIPTTQKYDWGKPGLSSKVAQFATASKIPGFTLEENAPYAELWMGTHPTSPSRVQETGQALSEFLEQQPQLIGQKVIDRFNAKDGNIPYLFKVLAIGKALSIQTHPDKETAEKLHAERPDVYKDDNHKPEMAIALTPFTALCGFLPLPTIASYLQVTPEFTSLVPEPIRGAFLPLSASDNPTGPKEKAALRDVFSAVMTAEPALFKEELRKLVERYEQGEVKGEENKVKDLVLRLNSQFPGDNGVFCAFMLNYMSLEPGEAIFLAAGEPHAYVSGDIMECMATSDNVIRAGLTPKLRDIPNLVSGLTYDSSQPTKHYVQPSPFSSSTNSTLYDPPIPEFSVVQVKLDQGEERHNGVDGPSIAIVTEGSGEVKWDGAGLGLGTGNVFFIGAGTEVTFVSNDKMTVYRAFVEAH